MHFINYGIISVEEFFLLFMSLLYLFASPTVMRMYDMHTLIMRMYDMHTLIMRMYDYKGLMQIRPLREDSAPGRLKHQGEHNTKRLRC